MHLSFACVALTGPGEVKKMRQKTPVIPDRILSEHPGFPVAGFRCKKGNEQAHAAKEEQGLSGSSGRLTCKESGGGILFHVGWFFAVGATSKGKQVMIEKHHSLNLPKT